MPAVPSREATSWGDELVVADLDLDQHGAGAARHRAFGQAARAGDWLGAAIASDASQWSRNASSQRRTAGSCM